MPSLPRRAVLGAGAALLVTPRLAAAQGSRVSRFVPQANLAVLGPVFTTAAVTTNHAMMVFDTLYGLDERYQSQPQMVEGHVVADDGLTWTTALAERTRQVRARWA